MIEGFKSSWLCWLCWPCWVAPSLAIVMAILTMSCTQIADQSESNAHVENLDSAPGSNPAWDDASVQARHKMVTTQLAKRDIVNRRVLECMRRVPRHQFVPADRQARAYDDSPLAIGHGQTISQPYIVALMTQLVDPQPHHKALDIGTGSGYQAAVLAELVKSVHSIEIVESLATDARERLAKMDYKNITVRHGNGYHGWKSEAPFDIIIVAAAPDHIPQALLKQLAPNGKMVIPVGSYFQTLMVIEKKPDGTIEQRDAVPVRFVPMTGEAKE